MPQYPFPEVIDSTMIATFRSCPWKFYLSYIADWKPKGESVHLVAGKAFAAGLETARRTHWEHGAPPEHALEAAIVTLLKEYGDFQVPEGSAKSPERMAGALEYYFNQFGWDTDSAQPIKVGNKWGIEFSFAEPLDRMHPTTGLPLIYSGRADCLVEYAGAMYILDDKTTSQLGNSWLNQWGLRSQFTGYTWAARKVGLDPKGVLVRGVSILKTKYDHAQVPTQRAPWEVDRWEAQVHRDLDRAISMWQDGAWDMNLDHACTEYGGCTFSRNVCKSEDPAVWLPVDFERRHWNPLTRTETLLEAE